MAQKLFSPPDSTAAPKKPALALAASLVALAFLLARAARSGHRARQQRRGDLKRSGDRMAGLLDSAMDAVITVDAAQVIVVYNRAAERIFGWPATAMMGQLLSRLIPSRYQDTHGRHIQRFGATGVTSRRMGGSALVYGQHADGHEFPLDASISQLDTPEGKLFTVILRDVSERVKAQEELAVFASEASAVREQEKKRIARELHDDLAQSITALKMDTIWVRDHLASHPEQAVERLAGMLAMLDESAASTRRIAADLRPLLLDDLGLQPAIEWLTQNFTQRTGVACTLDADEELALPEPYATAVFRIVQESLVNIAKHAKASRVHVSVSRTPSHVAMRVRDNGQGFDAAAPRKSNSLGLAGIRERGSMLKGTVRIDSQPGGGTTIQADIPVRQTEGQT